MDIQQFVLISDNVAFSPLRRKLIHDVKITQNLTKKDFGKNKFLISENKEVF